MALHWRRTVVPLYFIAALIMQLDAAIFFYKIS